MASLSLKHIYKVYPNGTKAVNDFTMEIQDKEFIVFVGPSGCGKSTTLRMIAGLEPITYGELMIGDEVVNGLEPKDRDIAMVFQNYALYPHLNIYENLAFGLRSRKVPKDEIDRKVNEVAKTLGIEEYLKKKPKEMSGGQRQRVALGRAIVREPKVMLLDEPLSNLDAKLRTQMRSEIVKLHQKLGTTFIYVTHDQVEAMTMGTRIVVMKDGFVQQIDTPKNLYRHPINRFVASFIGSPQMNFLSAKLSPEGKDVRIRFLDVEGGFTLPRKALAKMIPSYIDEGKDVLLGIRAEHVHRSEDGIPMKVSHLEELGNETLVYGDLDLKNESVVESKTKMILKTAGFQDIAPGQIIHVSFQQEELHFFDLDTGEAIRKRIPDANRANGIVSKGKLSLFEKSFELPPALSLKDGEVEVNIPLTAIRLGEGEEAIVSSCETLEPGKYLLSLSRKDAAFFALSGEPRKGTVSIDFSWTELSFYQANQTISSLDTENVLDGRFLLKKHKTTGLKKENHYYFSLLGQEFPSPETITKKMCRSYADRSLFHEEFSIAILASAISLSEDGIDAEIIDALDYGSEKFVKAKVGETMLLVAVNAIPGEKKVRLTLDLEKISVKEKRRNIQIL